MKLSFGASGSLTTQIRNGAPFDIFFSADEDYPKQLIEAGFAERDSLYRYAVGHLVLWVPASSALSIGDNGVGILLDPSVRKIAIANPQHAPYGRAAEVVLRHTNLYDKVRNKLVIAENVSQAAQFVESGNAQVGFIALSHAIAPQMRDKGRYWEIPKDNYPALNQAAVMLSHSAHKTDAAEFMEYLKSPVAKEVLRRYGFGDPEAAHP